jgi:hypothetical protein
MDPFVAPFGNGEGVLVYPGDMAPISSVRLELLREGLEDMEHLSLLRRAIERAREKLAAGHMQNAASIRIGEICRRLIRDDALRASGSRDMLLLPHFSREPGTIERVREEVIEETLQLEKRPYAIVLTQPEEKCRMRREYTARSSRGATSKSMDASCRWARPESFLPYFRLPVGQIHLRFY